MTGAARWAEGLARHSGLRVDLATTRKAGLESLRRRQYSLVILDDSIAEADPNGADLLWKNSGLAVPLQINFAISNGSRLQREVRAALARRTREHALALHAAAATFENELKGTITGLLLQSQLALADPAVTPQLREKLEAIANLVGTLRESLKPGRTETSSQ